MPDTMAHTVCAQTLLEVRDSIYPGYYGELDMGAILKNWLGVPSAAITGAANDIKEFLAPVFPGR